MKKTQNYLLDMPENNLIKQTYKMFKKLKTKLEMYTTGTCT